MTKGSALFPDLKFDGVTSLRNITKKHQDKPAFRSENTCGCQTVSEEEVIWYWNAIF
jgi:hypothetical protein